MSLKDPTQRFTSRVDNYVCYRPGYPYGTIELLKTKCGLTSDSVIADIGSGTGIFTRMLLDNGNRVYGVEPNRAMRAAGEKFLAAYPRFVSIDGSAEITTLRDHSVDFVTAAQAAHWFALDKARREFLRILKPGGWAVLLWNERRTDSTPFLRDYENLLQDYGADYCEVRHERTTSEIGGFFRPAPHQTSLFEIVQECDYAALEGRLSSTSYTPQAGDPKYGLMLKELRRVFDSHQMNGRVQIAYLTRVYYGRLDFE